MKKKNQKGIFLNVDEINNALERKLISIHSKNYFSIFNTINKDGNKIVEKHQSTAGRFLLAETYQNIIKSNFL